MKLAEKQDFDRVLFTGFGTVEVVAINPTREQLAKIKGYEIKPPEEGKKAPEEFSYEGKTEQGGEDYIDIVFYLRVVTHDDKPIVQYRVRLVDKDVVSEKEENGESTTRYQWVNQQGGQTFCDDAKNLLDKFTHVQVKGQNVADRQFRKAIQGESNLYNFLQSWLDKGVAFFGEASADTDIFIDKKKAFRNVEKYVESELRPLIGIDKSGRFNALLMVGISEKDGKVSHFQNVYNNFWPDWKFKSMVTSINTGDWNISDDTRKSQEYLIKSLKKSAYTLGWVKEFDPNNHIQSTNETFKTAPEGSSEEIDSTY